MLDKEKFFREYPIEETFNKSDLEWSMLEAIFDDYQEYYKELKEQSKDLQDYIENLLQEKSTEEERATEYHSLRCRVKDPMHLIEKIIRKRGSEHSFKYKELDRTNYRQIITDLIGVRILIYAKEDWKRIWEKLKEGFPDDTSKAIYMQEEPVAYTRYGDRDIYGDLIQLKHSNKGYRSQHYVVNFKGYCCEIQVRTMAEDVYGEFDHKVRYPYRDKNKFLLRYTNTFSQILDSVDELVSTCLDMGEDGWKRCEQYYNGDAYIDWEKINQKSDQYRKETGKQRTLLETTPSGLIDMKQSIMNSLLRKKK